MDPRLEQRLSLTRRQFLGGAGIGIGTVALGELLNQDLFAQTVDGVATGGLPGLPHFPPKAKRVIYLFQGGGPSQLDLWEYKPALEKLRATELPDSVRNGQRLTAMSANQASFPIAPTVFKFQQYGQSGAWISELMPYTAKVADELLFIKSLHTEQINHDPGVTFMQTGFQLPGRPSLGAWLTLRTGDDESGSSRIRGHDHRHRSTPRRADVGHRLHAEPPSGHQAAIGRRSSALRVRSSRL